MCVNLVIYNNYTEIHGQQNIKFSSWKGLSLVLEMCSKSILNKLGTHCKSVKQETRLTSDFLLIYSEARWKYG